MNGFGTLRKSNILSIERELNYLVVIILKSKVLKSTSNDIPLAVTITVMFANTVVELCPLAAAAAVAELVKPQRGLKVCILLSPANPGGRTLRHLHDLHLEVPGAPGDAVGGPGGAVELGPGDVEPVV